MERIGTEEADCIILSQPQKKIGFSGFSAISSSTLLSRALALALPNSWRIGGVSWRLQVRAMRWMWDEWTLGRVDQRVSLAAALAATEPPTIDSLMWRQSWSSPSIIGGIAASRRARRTTHCAGPGRARRVTSTNCQAWGKQPREWTTCPGTGKGWIGPWPSEPSLSARYFPLRNVPSTLQTAPDADVPKMLRIL